MNLRTFDHAVAVAVIDALATIAAFALIWIGQRLLMEVFAGFAIGSAHDVPSEVRARIEAAKTVLASLMVGASI